jgi:hypothetical protein
MSVARQIVGKLALNCCTQIICVATGRVVRDVNVGKNIGALVVASIVGGCTVGRVVDGYWW